MSLSDPIGDMLARLKNSQMRNHKKVELPSSKFKAKIAEILKSEGYIIDYEVKSDDNKANLHIILIYNLGNPVISSIERVSKPGCRVYSGINELPKVYNGLGISILSTPRVVMSDNEARAANVGGEVLCQVF